MGSDSYAVCSMEKRVVGEEYDGERLVRSWVFENGTEAVQSISDVSQHPSLLRWLKKGFLPDKYPDSVTPDYIGAFPESIRETLLSAASHGNHPGRKWNTVQTFRSGTRFRLCAHTCEA